MKLHIKKLYPNVITPSYGNKGDAGLDLSAHGDWIVPSRTRKLISTGICVSWVSLNLEDNPQEYYLRIAPRSGLAVKHSIDIGAGVIDSSYRGEIKICLINNSDNDFVITHGDRIAQGILEKIKTFESIEIVDQLDLTDRGEGGFGSTGINTIKKTTEITQSKLN